MTRSGLILPVLLFTFIGCNGSGSGGKLPDICENKTPEWVVDADGNQVKQGQDWSCQPNGAWGSATNYKSGKEHGTFTAWHETGVKSVEGGYLDGKKHGTWTSWYENGVKQHETEYQDGKDHGTWTSWYENGKKKVETEYQDGKLHGTMTHWYENRVKKLEAEYQDGKEHGTATFWYENGVKQIESGFLDGKKHGTVTVWSPTRHVMIMTYLPCVPTMRASLGRAPNRFNC